MKNIIKIGKQLGLSKKNLFLYGDYSAKITNYSAKNTQKNLILVSAINPTQSGEGKTTISIGLADSLKKLKKSVLLCLREPSMGPVFGVKGGAVGGGKAKILPEEDINLHFNGDFHAITYANNLICAYIDNHIYNGNTLNFDKDKITFCRCIDINDRALREIEINKEKLKNNVVRTEKFVITPASELMSIFCLSNSFEDLIANINNILVGFDIHNNPIYFWQLNKAKEIERVLRQSFYPNLVQTLYSTPCLVHGGPFANISIGTSSFTSINTALNLCDYVVTEAGFGFDLGGEKFLDIISKHNHLNPRLIILVCTIKALKSYNGDIKLGFEYTNHYKNVIQSVYGKQTIVSLNHFENDDITDIKQFEDFCAENNIIYSICDSYIKGENGAIDLAHKVIALCKQNQALTYAYDNKDMFKDKVTSICNRVYNVQNVKFEAKVDDKINLYGELLNNLPVVIAKTPYSLTDDKNILTLPDKTSVITITDIELFSGAKFILAKTKKIILMPGLPNDKTSA